MELDPTVRKELIEKISETISCSPETQGNAGIHLGSDSPGLL